MMKGGKPSDCNSTDAPSAVTISAPAGMCIPGRTNTSEPSGSRTHASPVTLRTKNGVDAIWSIAGKKLSVGRAKRRVVTKRNSRKCLVVYVPTSQDDIGVDANIGPNQPLDGGLNAHVG